jgi:hypothetical protein
MTCQQPGTSSPPSAVTLATILTDLDWRRHVALDWDNQPFYQRIAESIGEQSYPSWPLQQRLGPLPRARFQQLRAWSWGKPPLPPQRFK